MKKYINLFLIRNVIFIGLISILPLRADFESDIARSDVAARIIEIERHLSSNQSIDEFLFFQNNEIYVSEDLTFQEQVRCKRVAAFDIGSTGVKFLLADVNPFSNKIIKKLYKTTISTEFVINEENFGHRIAIIAGLKSIVQEHFSHYHDIEYYAVATAGFRRAGALGERLAKEIMHKVGVDFEIIDQEKEAQLAYYAVYSSEEDFDSGKSIIWDVGGGSIQLILQNEIGELENLERKLEERFSWIFFLKK